MCIDIIKNPVSAIIKAKKKNMKKTAITLVEACALFALTAAVVLLQRAPDQLAIAAVSFGSIFLVLLAMALVMGLVIKIISTTLGGKGQFYEGLTVVSYAMVPMSVSLLGAAVFAIIPGGFFLSALSLAIGFAYGISLLYRGVKEMFSTDMTTALVAISVLVIVLFIAASVSSGLSALASIGNLAGV